MIGRENFRGYWKAGFGFILVSSFMNSLLTIYMNYISSLPSQEWGRFGPILLFRGPAQSEWIAITIIFVIAFLALVPWLYGRLIEVFYNEFIMIKKTRTASA